MSRHALLLLANVDVDTHPTKHTSSSLPTPEPVVPAPRRRLWGRNILETAITLGLL